MKFLLVCLYYFTIFARGGCTIDSDEDDNVNYNAAHEWTREHLLTVIKLMGKKKAEIERVTNGQNEKMKQALVISQVEVNNNSMGQLKAEDINLKLEVLSLNEKNRLLNSEMVELKTQLAEIKNSTEANLAKILNLDSNNKILTNAIEMLTKEFAGLKSLIPPTTSTKPTTTASPVPNEWITIQRRGTKLPDGLTRQSFDLNWVEYANGFGNSSNNDFWLGLDKIAHLTKNGDYELRVELVSNATGTKYATYKYFQVSDATDIYRLKISGYSGTAVDALTYSNNMKFTTRDRDNDNYSYSNCAVKYGGAWWYNSCSLAGLNGPCGVQCTSLVWNSGFGSPDMDISFSEMKIRQHL